jgi:crossover junction endodeoxyribonuclease RusA
MLPLEFVVLGEPVSHQSHNKALRRQWQEKVRSAAAEAWPEEQAPSESDCLVVVVYYYGRGSVLLDNDNLVKPIQDALNGLVYKDDSQVTDTAIRRTNRERVLALKEGLLSWHRCSRNRSILCMFASKKHRIMEFCYDGEIAF